MKRRSITALGAVIVLATLPACVPKTPLEPVSDRARSKARRCG